MLKRVIITALMGCLVAGYVWIPTAWHPAVLTHLELFAYDSRMALTAYLLHGDTPVASNPRVVVIDIDNASLEQVGRWPWSRDTFATLVQRLRHDYEVDGIGLDVLFADETDQGETDNIALVTALQANLPVMAVSFQNQITETPLRSGQLGSGVVLEGITSVKPWWGQATGYVANLAQFLTPDVYTGHISPQRDVDGKVRRIKPIYQWNGSYYDTLALAMVRQRFQTKTLLWESDLGHWLDSQHLRVQAADAQVSIPVNRDGEVLIPYTQYKDYSPYERISAYKILQQDPDVDLWGKFVLIGSSATAQMDVVASPLNPELPGVEVHASMLAALLNPGSHFKVEPYHAPILQTLLIILIAGLLLWARQRSAWLVLLVGPSLLVVWLGGNVALWSQWHIALAILPPVLLIIMMLSYLVVSDLLDIQARHQHVKRLFSYYLPEPVAQRLASEQRNHDWLKAERREMTVMFADIQGFTTLADSMEPEAIAEITWELFSGLTGVIHAHGGTVDKYMGDAVMAFWGAPLHDQAHAEHAAAAAHAMQLAVDDMNTQIFNQKDLHIQLGIGINTGIMVVGNLGSSQRHTYTVMGSEVNKASAIQQLTREQGYAILVGENTAAQLSPGTAIDLGLIGSKKLPYKIRVFAVGSDRLH